MLPTLSHALALPRRKRWLVREIPEPFQLTKRDVTLDGLVAEHRFLRSTHHAPPVSQNHLNLLSTKPGAAQPRILDIEVARKIQRRVRGFGMMNPMRRGGCGSCVMRSFVSCGLAVFALAVPAAAQAQGASHDWTGFYAGLHAGAAWGTADADVGCDDAGSIAPGFCAAVSPLGVPPRDYTFDRDGFIGGGQAGYNAQFGDLVLGVETDISRTDVEDRVSQDNFVAGVGPQFSKLAQDLEWLGTVRGRLGWAIGNGLLYATGGLAYGRVDYRYSYSLPGAAYAAKDSGSATQLGWTAGGGAEIAFGQWSLKTEYLYYDLGEEDLAAELIVGGIATRIVFEPEFETQGHLARVGLSFHFN